MTKKAGATVLSASRWLVQTDRHSSEKASPFRAENAKAVINFIASSVFRQRDVTANGLLEPEVACECNLSGTAEWIFIPSQRIISLRRIFYFRLRIQKGCFE